MLAPARTGIPAIARNAAVFGTSAVLAAFCASIVLQPGQNSGQYLTRTVQCWFVGLGTAAVLAACLSRPGRRIWLAVASGCVLLLAFLSIHALAEPRLLVLNGIIPTSAPQGSTRSACLCGTRGVMLELFGRPDFATDGEMIGEQYAYRLDGGGDLVVYVFEEHGSIDDRLVAIERVRLTSAEIVGRRLMPVPSIR